jgi:transposase
MDYHVELKHHFYSVPYRYIRQTVEIRATAKTVEIFSKQQRIASHALSYERYRYTTIKEHMPPSHQAQSEYSLNFIMDNAKRIGQHTQAFMEKMLASRVFPQQAYRACYGVIRLAKRFGDSRLEQACAKGLSLGITRYQPIETFLKNGLEATPLSQVASTNPVTHDNVRGADYYQ